jgi:hypothetical protein
VPLYAADAPSAADWLEAWATVGGAVLSGVAVLVAILVVRRDQRLRRLDKLDAEAAQARMVFVAPERAIGSADEGWVGAHLKITNNSDRSVSELLVSAHPTRQPEVDGTAYLASLPPHTTHPCEIRFEESVPWAFSGPDPGSTQVRQILDSQMVYRDSTGTPWYRENLGEPEISRIRVRLPGTTRTIAEFIYLLPLLRSVNQFRRRCNHAVMSRIEARLAQRENKRIRSGALRDQDESRPEPPSASRRPLPPR